MNNEEKEIKIGKDVLLNRCKNILEQESKGLIFIVDYKTNHTNLFMKSISNVESIDLLADFIQMTGIPLDIALKAISLLMKIDKNKK